MEHILVPTNSKHSRIEVPLRAKENYSGPFESFLTRHKWGESSLTRSLSEAQVDSLQSLLQTWLFFGLLEEVFGPPCAIRVDRPDQPNAWIRRSHAGDYFISTASLRPLLMSLADGSTPKAHINHIQGCLKVATGLVNRLSLINSPLIETREVLAIAILCDSIEKSLGTNRSAFRAGGSLALGVSRYLEKRMLADHWCRHDVTRLVSQLDLSSLYLASNLDPPEQQVNHAGAGCTKTICKASRVDESRYLPVHDTPTCDEKCPFIYASEDELETILLSGVIPLIDYDPERDPNTLRLVPYEPGLPYVAISHVWSHGLGNQKDNAVRQCQLTRIHRLVRHLPDDPDQKATSLFWLDTICFPLHRPAAADRALVYMRKTYQDAAGVLVIDRYLTVTEAKPLFYIESLLRVLCSSWTRRLWTFQEGVLARKLFFQFADGPLEMGYAGLRAMAEMTFLTHDRSLEYLSIWLMASELWEAWKSCDSEDPKTVLNYLSGALRWRATSVAADEALCLATLIGLDMEALMDGPPEMRMQRFWALMPAVSAQAVFWSGQRVDSDGFRWAPSSFLSQDSAILQDLDRDSYSENMFRDEPARVTDCGLRFACAGILLNTWRAPVEGDLWIKLEGSQWFRLHRPEPRIKMEPKTDEQGDHSRSLVLLMKTSIAAAFFTVQPERSVTCVLASIYDVDEENDVIFANFEGTGFLMLAPREADHDWKGNLHENVAALGELQLAALDATASGASQSQASDISTAECRKECEDRLPATSGANVKPEKERPVDASTAKTKLLKLLAEDGELRRSRVRVRNEDGRLSVDKDGSHYIFYGAELAEDQAWCLG